jgi:transposase
VRTRDDIVAMRTAATNQLTALLDAHWPGATKVFADIESPIALAFLTRYPTAKHAAGLGEKRMQAFCVKHGYSGRRAAGPRLRSAPAGTTDSDLVEAVRNAVLALVAVLRTLGEVRKDLDRSVTAHLGEHPDAAIFTSLPRSGQINAAQVLAEWGDSRQAYDSPDAVAALAGLTPVTKASGKYHAVHFRWACNKRFRKAMVTFADNSRHESPWAADVYRRAIQRGHDHPQHRTGPGARLGARHLPMLAQPGALRPGPARQRESGGPGESHPRAPTERSVTVSRHSALLIAARRTCGPISSARTARVLDR